MKRFVAGFNLVTLEILPFNCLSAEVPDCVQNSAFDKKAQSIQSTDLRSLTPPTQRKPEVHDPPSCAVSF